MGHIHTPSAGARRPLTTRRMIQLLMPLPLGDDDYRLVAGCAMLNANGVLLPAAAREALDALYDAMVAAGALTLPGGLCGKGARHVH